MANYSLKWNTINWTHGAEITLLINNCYSILPCIKALHLVAKTGFSDEKNKQTNTHSHRPHTANILELQSEEEKRHISFCCNYMRGKHEKTIFWTLVPTLCFSLLSVGMLYSRVRELIYALQTPFISLHRKNIHLFQKVLVAIGTQYRVCVLCFVYCRVATAFFLVSFFRIQ